MIQRLQFLGNDGQFEAINAGTQIPLSRLVLVPAGNARAKATLTVILRSFGPVLVLAAALLLPAAAGRTEPITVCPANPHYFMREGKPFVLVTSDHHYGAVIDADFDYARFLDFLAATGMNLTRIYPGSMFEPADKYVAGNPLGPLPGRHILPWMRSDEAGAAAALAELGKPESLIRYVQDRIGHDRRYSLDFSRLAALGYKPREDFEAMLSETVRWYVDNRAWWEPLKAGA